MNEALKIKMPDISEIDIDELIENSLKGTKSLNAYFIYRVEYKKQAVANGLRLKMTEISKRSAESWKNEKAKVKRDYKKLAKRLDDKLERRKQEAIQIYDFIYDGNMEKVIPPITTQYPIINSPEMMYDISESFHPEEMENSLSLNVDQIILSLLGFCPWGENEFFY